MTNLSANFPQFNEAPIRIDPKTGAITWSPTWYRFLINQFQRTGGASGPNVNAASGGVAGFSDFSTNDGSDDFMLIPGPVGPQGIRGPQGPMASAGFDMDESDSAMVIPGPIGATGIRGPTGSIVYLEAPEADEPLIFPGPVGPTGATGATGTTGATGAQGPVGPAVYLEAPESDEAMAMPGQQGIAGLQGVAGISQSGLSLYFDEREDAYSEAISQHAPVNPLILGQLISNSATAVSLTTATQANITSISLTEGDWDVFGNIEFLPAGTTPITTTIAGISTVSATFGAFNTVTSLAVAFFTGANQYIPTPIVQISVSTTTTVYLVGLANFSVSTCTANGAITARRASV